MRELSDHEDIGDIESEHSFDSILMYEQMINDDLVANIEAEEEMIHDDSLPQTPEIPTNISDTTVSFERSAERKRELRILNQPSESDTEAECSYLENDSQTKKKSKNDDVPPYEQLRLNKTKYLRL